MKKDKMSLRAKFLSILALACGLCALIAIVGFLYFNKIEMENGIVQRERSIQLQLIAATEHVASQGGLVPTIQRILSQKHSADELTENEKLDILKQVPIYSAMVIGKKNAAIDHYQFRIFAAEPRRKENLATDAEMKIYDEFLKNPKMDEKVVKESNRITVYKPVRLSAAQGCLNCHGNPSNSPWKNGTDILGYKMENWVDGQIHGVFAISQNPEEVVAAGLQGHWLSPSSWLVVGIFAGFLVSLLFAVWFLRPIFQFFATVATRLNETSETVHQTSQEIAKGSQQMAEATTEQAAALQEATASLAELTAMVGQNAQSSETSSLKSGESLGQAKQGQQVVANVIHAIQGIQVGNQNIQKAVESSHQRLTEIVRVISEIGDKTKVINEIVFQTKLLSFNASVEAARAGEHGKGFAVVAEEVGNLAKMSGHASQEISKLLQTSLTTVETIIQETQTTVGALIQTGQRQVDDGASVAKQCGQVLESLVDNTQVVSQMAAEISTATQEQSQGLSELNKAVMQIETVTQVTASQSEQSAGNADRLAKQSEDLRLMVNDLLALLNGHREQPSAAELEKDHFHPRSAPGNPSLGTSRPGAKPPAAA